MLATREHGRPAGTVTVLIDYPVMEGVVTSLVDAAINLTAAGVPCRALVVTQDDIRTTLELVRRLRWSTPRGWPFTVVRPGDLPAEVDTLLTSFGTLRRRAAFPVIGRRTVVLDSGTVLRDQLLRGGRGVAYVNSLRDRVDLRVLGCSANAEAFPGPGVYTRWLHRFSRARLEHLEHLVAHTAGAEVFNEADRARRDDADEVVQPAELMARTLTYQRWAVVTPGMYAENIGKVIFEFRWLGRPVHYSPVNRTQPDGLTEYLAALGVDDRLEQDLTFTRADVDRVLGFNPADDALLRAVTDR